MGLNGVDNGRLWLDSVRIPRTNLLDKYGSVSATGVYSSPIKSDLARFTSMISALVGGRIVVAQGAIHMGEPRGERGACRMIYHVVGVL